MIYKNITDEEINNRLKIFLKHNIDLYDEEELKLINRITRLGKCNCLSSENIRQITDEIDILDDEYNIYTGFANLVNNTFDINRSVVEVGSGKLPRLSIKIRGLQTKGDVYVYDPILTKRDYDDKHLILKREKFNKDTIIPKDSLIISFMPCEYTADLIEYATDNKHDFMIALCGCNHYYSPYVDFDDSLHDWYANMEYLARRGIEENNLGEFGMTYLKKYDDPYPILYNKRK